MVKRLGCSVDHPLPYSAEVKYKVELRLYSIFVAYYMVRFSNYTIHSFRISYMFPSPIAAIFRELHYFRTRAACTHSSSLKMAAIRDRNMN
jgi:hypothetical protein